MALIRIADEADNPCASHAYPCPLMPWWVCGLTPKRHETSHIDSAEAAGRTDACTPKLPNIRLQDSRLEQPTPTDTSSPIKFHSPAAENAAYSERCHRLRRHHEAVESSALWHQADNPGLHPFGLTTQQCWGRTKCGRGVSIEGEEGKGSRVGTPIYDPVTRPPAPLSQEHHATWNPASMADDAAPSWN